jgi:hypothetical protein
MKLSNLITGLRFTISTETFGKHDCQFKEYIITTGNNKQQSKVKIFKNGDVQGFEYRRFAYTKETNKIEEPYE